MITKETKETTKGLSMHGHTQISHNSKTTDR